MMVAALAILGPLAAVILILATRRGAAALALGGTVVAAVAALVTLARVAAGGRYAATLPGLPGLPLRLAVDPLAAVLAATVAVVSLLVLVYAVGYMAREADQARFYAGMACFSAAMQGVVLADDWLLLGADRPRLLPADRLLVRPTGRAGGGHAGVPHHTRGRLRPLSRHLRARRRERHDGDRPIAGRARGRGDGRRAPADPRRAG